MGLFKLSTGDAGARIVPGNPVPYRFTIERTHVGAFGVVARIRYPDATNYEGVKICLFRDVTAQQVLDADVLDPHFREDPLSPFARFEPTEAGWQAACALADVPAS